MSALWNDIYAECTGTWKMLVGTQICPTPGCGWETTAEEWHESWKHPQIHVWVVIFDCQTPQVLQQITNHPFRCNPTQISVVTVLK